MARIGIDFDGVKVSFMDGFPEWHNQRYGTQINETDINDYDVSTAWGHDAEYWQIRIEQYAQEHQRFNLPKPLPGSVEAIGSLAARHELVLITARPEYEREIVEGVIDKYFDGMYQQVIMRDPATHFFGMDKGEIAKTIGASVLIDDHHSNVDSATASGLVGIMFGDYGWNRRFNDGTRLQADNWHEVQAIVADHEHRL